VCGGGCACAKGTYGDVGLEILVAAGTFVGRSQELGADPGYFFGGVYN